jgi:hypothetical protein
MSHQYTGLFHSATAEEKFFKRYEALVDLVGQENVLVCLPMHWSSELTEYCGNLRLQFSTVNEIKIVARCNFVVIEESSAIFEIKLNRRPFIKTFVA